MARATRIFLDIALVSLEMIRPAVVKGWEVTKTFVTNTRAKTLVCNEFINKLELGLNSISGSLCYKLTTLRNKQLPAEIQYLEKELEKVKKMLEEKQNI